MVQSADKIYEPTELDSIDVKLSQIISTMPESLKVEVLHYAEYLLQKLSEKNISSPQNEPENTAEKQIPKKNSLSGCMKGTFVLPLPDDFNEPLENFEQAEQKYGYGSLAGKMIMSDDFDERIWE